MLCPTPKKKKWTNWSESWIPIRGLRYFGLFIADDDVTRLKSNFIIAQSKTTIHSFLDSGHFVFQMPHRGQRTFGIEIKRVVHRMGEYHHQPLKSIVLTFVDNFFTTLDPIQAVFLQRPFDAMASCNSYLSSTFVDQEFLNDIGFTYENTA